MNRVIRLLRHLYLDCRADHYAPTAEARQWYFYYTGKALSQNGDT